MFALGRARAASAQDAAARLATLVPVPALRSPSVKERQLKERDEVPWIGDLSVCCGAVKSTDGFVALRKRPRSIMLRPVDQGLRIPDQTMLKDRIFVCCRPCTVAWETTTFVCICLMVVLLIPGIIATPFVILDYTGLSNATGNAAAAVHASNPNNTSSNSTTLPGVAWWTSDITIAACTIHDMLMICMLGWAISAPIAHMHPAVMRLTLRGEYAQIGMVLSTSFGYAIAVGLLLPARSHLLFLAVFKVVVPFYSCFHDASVVGQKLRYSIPGRIMWFGSADDDTPLRTSGKMTVFIGLGMSVICGLDVVRHYAVVFAAKTVTLIDLELTNPLDGTRITFSNKVWPPMRIPSLSCLSVLSLYLSASLSVSLSLYVGLLSHTNLHTHAHTYELS